MYLDKQTLLLTETSRDVGLSRGDGNQVVVQGDSLMQPLPGLIQGVDAVPDTQTISTVLLHSSVCWQFESQVKFTRAGSESPRGTCASVDACCWRWLLLFARGTRKFPSIRRTMRIRLGRSMVAVGERGMRRALGLRILYEDDARRSLLAMKVKREREGISFSSSRGEVIWVRGTKYSWSMRDTSRHSPRLMHPSPLATEFQTRKYRDKSPSPRVPLSGKTFSNCTLSHRGLILRYVRCLAVDFTANTRKTYKCTSAYEK